MYTYADMLDSLKSTKARCEGNPDPRYIKFCIELLVNRYPAITEQAEYKTFIKEVTV